MCPFPAFHFDITKMLLASWTALLCMQVTRNACGLQSFCHQLFSSLWNELLMTYCRVLEKKRKTHTIFFVFLSNLRRPVPLSTQTIQAKEKETSRLNPSSASYLGALKLEPEDCDCGELWEGLTGSVDVPDGWESVALAPWTVASVDVPVSMAAVCSAALFLGFCIAKQQTTTMSHKLNDKLTDAD